MKHTRFSVEGEVLRRTTCDLDHTESARVADEQTFPRSPAICRSATLASMSKTVLIDGNNVLHALRELGPAGGVGREALVRLVERWAERRAHKVILVFDGPVPMGPYGRQLRSKRVSVRFSRHVTADDVIVDYLEKHGSSGGAEVVTDDRAIRADARRHRCRSVAVTDFIDELYPQPRRQRPPQTAQERRRRRTQEKPDPPTPAETERWLREFGYLPPQSRPLPPRPSLPNEHPPEGPPTDEPPATDSPPEE
jgi:predicted RNA-binding protein with PIN domain